MTSNHRTRSPLRERERSTSPQRRDEVDYGHDAEQHVRHIARTRQLTAFAGDEGTPRSWPWVLQSLAHHRFEQGTGCPVDVLDTLLYCDGSPDAFYYTKKGSVVSNTIGDDEGCTTLVKAMVHLRSPPKYVGSLATTSASDVGVNGAVAFTSGGEAIAVKGTDMDKIRKAQSAPPTGTEALVLLVPTKGPCAELLLNIQHTFSLEPCTGKPVHRSYRLVFLKGISRRIPCQSLVLNKKLERLCKNVVLWIEAYSEARVLRIVLEVVEDIQGDLWFVRSSECYTTRSELPYSRQRRSPSPSQSKAARIESAKDIADELSLWRFGHAIGESAPGPALGLGIMATGSTGRGQHAEEGQRLRRRVQTAMSPAEASGSQGTLDAEEWGFKRNESPASMKRNSPRPQTVSSSVHLNTRGASTPNPALSRKTQRYREGGGVQDIGVTFEGFAGPGEHDPREIGRTAAAGRALGSSQLGRMCHGDFCSTDLLDKIQQQARFEQEETGNGSLSLAAPFADNDDADMSAFRRQILKLDEVTLQDHGVLPAEGGLMKAAVSEKPCTDTKGKRRGRGVAGGGQRVGEGAIRSEQQGSAVDAGEAGARRWNEVPFSWVVRGRQERHLVDQQLRRYRRGHKEPFVGHLSGLGESSVSLGALFPATYYQPVRVCHNCYRVYSMIDQARSKSAPEPVNTGIRATRRRSTRSRSKGAYRGQQQRRAAKRARGEAGLKHSEEATSMQKSPSRVEQDDEWGVIRQGRARSVIQAPSIFSSSSVFPDSPSGEGNQRNDEEASGESVSGESSALLRAQAAIDGLTRVDICELRSFSKPPAAVNMATAALMIALTGQGEPTAAGWLSAKRYMTNVDKLFSSIAGLNLSNLRVSQTRKLEAYVANPAFRPDVIACVSLPASKICAWILGVLEAHRWRTGRGHPRLNVLGKGPGRAAVSQPEKQNPPAISCFPFGSSSVQSRPNNLSLMRPGEGFLPSDGASCGEGGSARPWTSFTPPPRSRVTTALGPAVYPFPHSAAAATAAATVATAGPGPECHSSRRQSAGSDGIRPSTTTCFNPRTSQQAAVPPQAWIPAGAVSKSGGIDALGGSPSRTRTAPATDSANVRNIGTGGGEGISGRRGQGDKGGEGRKRHATRAGRAAAKRRQDQVDKRLADATAAAPDPAGFERSDFLCSDGVTFMPYAVVGKGAPLLPAPGATALRDVEEETRRTQADSGGGTEREGAYRREEATSREGVLSFVVVHDFFDTLEKTFLLFKPLVLKHPGCQVLCFNSPGQVGTRVPPEPEGLLTNTWVADRLDELMQHVDNMGEMPLSDRPFHLLGIGNGASIAAAFACRHASKSKWKSTLRSLACVNGFATVDAQLAAVLHSAQRAFQCFPPERPDLPISFWSRFVFSEDYLRSVGSDLALNILCAVANPLGAEGMLRIVKGALKSRDLTKELKSVALPLVLVQSTENMLVNAANVDPFLEGRRPRHVWSHQLRLRAPAPASTVTTADKEGNANSNSCVTCLGPGGEQALFESLASGAEGAFVAWVKGGHETRQECKRLVVDVLDLLAAPGGQIPAFFKRGALARRAPGGRVGIAAAGKSAAGMGAGAAGKEKREGESPSVSRIVHHNNGDGEKMVGNGNVVSPVESGTTFGSDCAVEEGSDEQETWRKAPVLEDGGVGREGDTGLTYGYASLRRIRERDPLPEFPRTCGRRRRSPNAGSRSPGGASSSRAQHRSRTLTAPVSPGKRSRKHHENGHDLRSPEIPPCRSQQGRSRERSSPSGTGAVRWSGDGASNWEDRERATSGEIRGGTLTLEEAVADFDVALRDHRNKRRGLGSSILPPAALPGSGLHDGGEQMREEGTQVGGIANSQLHATVASGWLNEGATSWEAVAPGLSETFREQHGWSVHQSSVPGKPESSAGRGVAAAGGGMLEAAAATHKENDTPETAIPVEDACLYHGDSQDIRERASIDGAEAAEWSPLDDSSRSHASPLPAESLLAQHDTALDGDKILTSRSHTYVQSESRAASSVATEPGSTGGGSPAPSSAVVSATEREEWRRIGQNDQPFLGEGSPKLADSGASIAPDADVSNTAVQTTTVRVEGDTRDHPPTQLQQSTVGGSGWGGGNGLKGLPSHPTPELTAARSSGRHDEELAMAAENTTGAVSKAALTAPQIVQAMESPDPIATIGQRTTGDWMEGTTRALTITGGGGPRRLPAPLEVAEAEAELAHKVERMRHDRLASEREQRDALDAGRATEFGQARAARAEGFAEEDRKALAAEERRLADLRREADLGRLQRGAEFEETEEALSGVADRYVAPATSKVDAAMGLTGTTGVTPMPVRGMRPQRYTEQENLPDSIKKSLAKPSDKVLDDMEMLEARAKAAGGGINLQAFERVEQRQRVRQVERMEILHGQTAEEKSSTMLRMAVRLQMFFRQKIAKMRVARLRHARSASKEKIAAATTIQSLVRGHISRTSVRRVRRQLLDEAILGGRATAIQRLYRGHRGRLVFMSRLRDSRCRVLQKAARGFLGRRVASRKRALLAGFAIRASSATKLQSAWRGKMARDSYLRVRCSWLASREIQRFYRGHLGRRATRRRREWQSAGPGPERLKLGLRMIEDTKVAFAKQQGEIAALNRAQEKAEARVSSIHHQLKASESELSVLEGEMAGVRTCVSLSSCSDRTGELTGAADFLGGGFATAAYGFLSVIGLGKADAYALEMQLQLKRAEREQRRTQLSTEFASTFADVSDKKRQLDRLSAAVADIEATRLRKSREFGHMQRNLMELLSEQKRELDIVREKGVQLETAAATSAAAAAATAQRARDHEAKAACMYEQTEELMKFQFMSMSLSYFSSLNMMKQVRRECSRDGRRERENAAFFNASNEWDCAPLLGSGSRAIPSLKETGNLGGDAVSQALALRKDQVKTTQVEIAEAEASQRHPFPTELSLWTVDDVGRWLDTLQLGEYKQAFREGKVDGSFLGELRESDLMDSIGMEHKLHLKKLLLARQKLTPLSEAEKSMASSVRREELATSIREEIPDIDTAFSQARHGKKKRLEETLNTGFDINAEDSMGNTLLIVAVQQLQMPIVEFLVRRGADVNHCNTSGNTPLHFAMSYDTSGKMGEYLINNGADDTIENKQGLSP
ncbi:unnamed protein product, partial [Scytosiphon promiscuus]